MPARAQRIVRGDDYRSTVRTGRRVGGAYCITHAVFRRPEDGTTSSEAPARFGFIVSKAVGNAVTRNRVRRRFKTIAERRINSGFAGVDVVFRALPAAAGATFAELEHEANRALDRVENMRVSA